MPVSADPNVREFADVEVFVDFTHPDAVQRRGQTLTVTVTAEDTGYPGLGAVSHVAEVVLQTSPLPLIEGNFVDSALTSDSRIEGNFVGGGGEITVFGTEADSTTEDLALFNLSFSEASANLSFTGNGLALRGGTLVFARGRIASNGGASIAGIWWRATATPKPLTRFMR